MILKKPDFWNKKKPNIFSFLLIPFTLPIRINNFLLNKFKKTKSKKIYSICIGNIYIGGTGKTPTTIKLYQILKKFIKKLKKQKNFIILRGMRSIY